MNDYDAKVKLVFDVLSAYIQNQISEEDVLAVLDGITHDNTVSDIVLELFEFIKTLETSNRQIKKTLKAEGLDYLIAPEGGETNEG